VAYSNPKFDLRGINHMALTTHDMAATVDFYTEILGFPMVKTLDMGARGQHFFFDCNNGVDGIAFFWFADAPADHPGIARSDRAEGGRGISAVGSMNHLSLEVPAEKLDEYRDRLRAKGIAVTEVVNDPDGHVDPDAEEVYRRAIYFSDPNNILLEFAAWTRELNAADVRHAPKTAAELVTARESAHA